MRPETLIIGYGNTLRGDDGAGPAVIDRIARRPLRPRLQLRAAHQLTPELAEEISRAELVIFVDARDDAEPGVLSCTPLSPGVPDAAAFTHQFNPATLLSIAARLYGRAPEAWLIGIGGASFDPGEKLSPAVVRAIEHVAAQWYNMIEECRQELLRHA